MAQNIESDFSGGFTDFYLDPAPNKHSVMLNWLINKDGSMAVRYGSEHYDVNFPRPTTSRINKVFEFLDTLFVISETKLFRYTSSGWIEMLGPTSEAAFPGATVTSSYSFVTQNNHLYITSDALVGLTRKIYKKLDLTFAMTTAGLPKLVVEGQTPARFTFTTSTALDAKAYIYYFVASRGYSVDGLVAFRDYGPVSLLQVTDMADMTTFGKTITIIPDPAKTLWPHPANTATDFYDQSTGAEGVKIRVYRTRTNGTVGYLVAELPVGYTGNYVDNKSDAQLGEEIYINGDVSDWFQPPLAKYVVQSQDIVWYGNIKDTINGVVTNLPYRLRQSIKFGPDKCPASFFLDFDGDISGMGSIGDFPIVFTNDKCWRIEGSVDTQGNGFSRKVLISDTIGCLSDGSIVQSKRGLAFAGNDGMYYTDGYNLTRITDDISQSYLKLIGEDISSATPSSVPKELRRKRISGGYDATKDRYWWAVQFYNSSVENDSFLILDAVFGISEKSSFTLVDSGNDMQPSACVFVRGELIRADVRGFLFRHRKWLYEDPVVDLAQNNAALWKTKAVPYEYISSARSMGDSTKTKWAGVLQSVWLNETDLSVGISTSDDNQGDWGDLKEMRFRGHYTWGMNSLVWGDAKAIWNQKAFVFFERRFPRGSLRFTYKQIRFRPSYTVISASSTNDLCFAYPANGSVIISGAVNAFDPTMVGQFIHFEHDGYATGYEIQQYISKTEVRCTPGPAGFLYGPWKWEVRGFNKGERPSLRNHITLYESFGDSQSGWKTSDGVSNG